MKNHHWIALGIFLGAMVVVILSAAVGRAVWEDSHTDCKPLRAISSIAVTPKQAASLTYNPVATEIVYCKQYKP